MPRNKGFFRSTTFYAFWSVIILAIVAGLLIWRNSKYKIANKKIDQLVTVKSKGLYQISYENLHIDEVLGNISAENIEVVPDSLIYQSLVDQNKDPKTLFAIYVPKLLISGVKTPKALLNKEISAHVIRIQNAKIEIRLGESNTNNDKDSTFRFREDLYRQILGKLKSIKADSVILENAHVVLKNKVNETVRVVAEGLNISFSGVAIDSTEKNESNRMLFSKDIAIECDHLDIPFKNKVYTLQVNGLSFESQKRHFHTDKITLKPLLSESSFARANKFAKDRLDINLGNLDIWQLDGHGLLNQELIADTVIINKASIKIFRDKSYPHDSIDRTHDFPQEELMRMSTPVDIKKMIIKDSYLEYKEKNDKSDSSGKVTFFHVNTIIDNITNIPDYIRLDNEMRVVFHSSFLNQAYLSANLRMRLNDKKGDFSLNAKMNGLDGKLLNPLLRPMALAELSKGKINSLQFHLDATNKQSKGELILKYENISVKLLKKDEGKNKYKTKLLPTLAAGIILKDSNPKNGETRIGRIDFNRDIHRSMFNMIWKSLLTAIKQVAM